MDQYLRTVQKERRNLAGTLSAAMQTTMGEYSEDNFQNVSVLKKILSENAYFKCTSGEWQPEEDLTILNYVLEHGPKWAILSKQFLANRNQHAVKNRFFSLVSTYTLIPIRKIKREIEYLNKFLIKETLEYNVKLQEEKTGKSQQENTQNELINLSSDEFLNYISSPSEEGFPLCSYFDDLLAKM